MTAAGSGETKSGAEIKATRSPDQTPQPKFKTYESGYSSTSLGFGTNRPSRGSNLRKYLPISFRSHNREIEGRGGSSRIQILSSPTGIRGCVAIYHNALTHLQQAHDKMVVLRREGETRLARTLSTLKMQLTMFSFHDSLCLHVTS
jgi:hypothetical protein